LNSVAAQTIRDFECLVVDDGSPTPAKLPTADSRFRLIRLQVNGGVAAARNTGLKAATGRYITFLDDDDCWLPQRLALAIDVLKEGTVAVCASCQIGSQSISTPRVRVNSESILERSSPPLGATSICLSDCPPFDETYKACEDLEWWLRVSRHLTIVTRPEVGWLWRSHNELRQEHGTQARIDGSWRLLEQHSDYFRVHPAAAAYRMVRIGWMSRSLGRNADARRAAIQAFRINPTARTAKHTARLMVGR
jgi:glycosyltransferase involved in cell wall biosynthesis